MNSNEFLVNLLAGATTGLFSDTMMSPIDTVRTTLVSPHHRKGRSAWQIAKDISCTHGIQGFYQGIGPVCLLSPIASAVFFASRQHLSSSLIPWWENKGEELKKNPSPIVAILGDRVCKNAPALASSSSGMIAQTLGSMVWTPMAVLRYRQQTAASKGIPVPSTFELAGQLGVKGLFRGFTAGLAMTLPFQSLYWPVYDKTFKSIAKLIGEEDTPRNKMPAWTIMCSSITAGFFTSLLTYPIGTVAVNQQLSDVPKSMVGTAMDLYKNDGIASFYQGFGIKFLGSIPRSLITMYSNEKFREFYSQVLTPGAFDELPKKLERISKNAEKRCKK
ncbi:hypothetical protein GEMRC1_008803 [Eukaryota sp. GEM-RC1]